MADTNLPDMDEIRNAVRVVCGANATMERRLGMLGQYLSELCNENKKMIVDVSLVRRLSRCLLASAEMAVEKADAEH